MLGLDDTRVDAILLGLVASPRIDRVIAARAKAFGLAFEAMKQDHLQKISLRRMVTKDDIAAIALFLCSFAASNTIRQAISVERHVEYLQSFGERSVAIFAVWLCQANVEHRGVMPYLRP